MYFYVQAFLYCFKLIKYICGQMHFREVYCAHMHTQIHSHFILCVKVQILLTATTPSNFLSLTPLC